MVLIGKVFLGVVIVRCLRCVKCRDENLFMSHLVVISNFFNLVHCDRISRLFGCIEHLRNFMVWRFGRVDSIVMEVFSCNVSNVMYSNLLKFVRNDRSLMVLFWIVRCFILLLLGMGALLIANKFRVVIVEAGVMGENMFIPCVMKKFARCVESM